MIITELDVRDWQRLKNVRLAALRDAPGAFVTSLEIERNHQPSQWMAYFDRLRWVVALAAGREVGVVAVAPPDLDSPPYCRYLESIWVDPVFRRQGVLRMLLDHVEREVRKDEVTDLRLWVLDTNSAAARAYRRLGFRLVPHSTQATLKPRNGPESAESPFVTERLLVKLLRD